MIQGLILIWAPDLCVIAIDYPLLPNVALNSFLETPSGGGFLSENPKAIFPRKTLILIVEDNFTIVYSILKF